MSISTVSFAGSANQTVTHPKHTQFEKDFASLLKAQNKAHSAVADAAPGPVAAAADTATAATGTAKRSNFELRQLFYGIKPPVATDAPDADGRIGSYRKAVDGIDPRIAGNPGYADYYGLGGTAAVVHQAERNQGMNMGLSIANPAIRQA